MLVRLVVFWWDGWQDRRLAVAGFVAVARFRAADPHVKSDGLVEAALVVGVGLGHGRDDRRASGGVVVAEWAGPHRDAWVGLMHGPAALVFEPVVVPAGGGQVR
ncbi:MAG TPA: hypothetical protein VFY84_09820, partial [Jiangellales bacterium]|nr:hypothetical protein [Jiangellales bacterium]